MLDLPVVEGRGIQPPPTLERRKHPREISINFGFPLSFSFASSSSRISLLTEGRFFETEEEEEEDEDEEDEVEDGVGAENKVSLISDIFLQTFKCEAAHARSEGVIGVA